MDARLSVVTFARSDRNRRVLVLGTCALAVVAVGGAAGALSTTSHVFAVVAVGLVLLPIALWRIPETGIALLIGAAILVEQYPAAPLFGLPGVVTDQLPVFISLSDGLGISGVKLNPLELFLALYLGIAMVRARASGRLRFRGSYLSTGLMVLAGFVLLAMVWGISHGGDTNMALWEIRPWLYVVVFSTILAQFLDARAAVRWFLWGFVVAVALRSLEGIYRLIASHGMTPRPDFILGHEESIFFSLFIILVIALWLFRMRGRLRTVATWTLPLVLVSDLGNSRRVAWLILIPSLAVLGLLAWLRLPDQRRLITGVFAVVAFAGSIYVPVFWNGTGYLAQPVRAFRSGFQPDARDKSSDAYRRLENANLTLNIIGSAPFGAGFGIPIDYSIPMPDLTKTDPFLKYIPHNGVLWVWLRLGLFGSIVFWWVVGAGIMAATRLSRSPDRERALLGVLTTTALIGYVIYGYYDLGFYEFRIALLIGAVYGLIQLAGRMEINDGSSERRPPPRWWLPAKGSTRADAEPGVTVVEASTRPR